MNIIAISLRVLEPKRRALEEATKDPVKAQEKVLFEYLDRNKDTEYGRKYGFAGIRSVDDYRRGVPAVDYEDIRPYVDRMASGEDNLLTRDKVTFFGVTSGTTDRPKLIPSTKYSEARKDELLNLWSYCIARDYPDVLDGKILAIVSPEDEGRTASGTLIGAESGHSYKALPKMLLNLYALPYEVFEIEDYEARHYMILRLAIAEDIRTIATLNPNMIILLCRKIGRWQDTIIDDIRNGTISGKFDISLRIREAISRRLKPDARRADELKAMIEEGGNLSPRRFWPNLRIIECWKGGMMRLYLKELGDYFGNVPTRDMGCISTEARSSIPVNDTDPGGILAIQTNFYEFIPRRDAGKGSARTLTCGELKAGEEYFLIVTTAGGLYRYYIDDIVRVYGFFNRTPMIEFVQKGHGATSLAGEKLYESHVNEALEKVLDKHKIALAFFCAVAKAMDGPRYDLLAEFSSGAGDDDKKLQFLRSFEEELRRQDREYDYARNAQLLKSPVLKVVSRGSFEKFRSKRISEGAQEGQFKAPHLTSDNEFERNFSIEKTISILD